MEKSLFQVAIIYCQDEGDGDKINTKSAVLVDLKTIAAANPQHAQTLALYDIPPEYLDKVSLLHTIVTPVLTPNVSFSANINQPVTVNLIS
jgi:hypothetical protein